MRNLGAALVLVMLGAVSLGDAAASCTGSANISSATPLIDDSPLTLIPGESGTCGDGKYIYLVGNDGTGTNLIRRVSVAEGGDPTRLTEAEGLPKGGPSSDQYFTYCDVFSSGEMFLRYGTDNPEIWLVSVAWFDEFGEISSMELWPILATDASTWTAGSATHPEVCDPDGPSGDNGANLRWYGALGNFVEDPQTGSLYVISHFCKSIYRVELSIPGLCCGGGGFPQIPLPSARHMQKQCQCHDGGLGDGDDEGPPLELGSRRMATQCDGGDAEGPPLVFKRPMQIQCGDNGGEVPGPLPAGEKVSTQRRKKSLQGRRMQEQFGLPDSPYVAFRVGGQIKSPGTDDDSADAFGAKLNEARYGAFFAGKLYFLDTSGLRVFDPSANGRDGSITTLAGSPGLDGFLEGLNSAAKIRFAQSTSFHVMSGSTLVILDNTNHAVWGVELSVPSSLSYGLLLPSDGTASSTYLSNPVLMHPMGVESFLVADDNGIRVVESLFPALCYESASTTNMGSITTLTAFTGAPVGPPPGPVLEGKKMNIQSWINRVNEKKKKMKRTKKGDQRRATMSTQAVNAEQFAVCTDGTSLYMGADAVMKVEDPTDLNSLSPLVFDSTLCQDGCEFVSQCDIHGDTMYLSWEGGSVIGRMSLAGGDTGIALISSYDFDYWGSSGELLDNTRCDGGFDDTAKTFGTVGNFISGGAGYSRFYLFGNECGVLWEYNIFMTNVEVWIVAGMSTATDAGGAAVDSADPLTARLKGPRYGAFHQSTRGDLGRVLFLDESGLRKYTIGGGVTTLTESSPTWSNLGYAAGLNSVASMPLSAGTSPTAWSQMVIREGSMLYISDPVNHAVWAGDVSDNQNNILWGPVIGGYPTALGAGSTDGSAATGQLDSVLEMFSYQEGVMVLDNNGFRTIAGRSSKCAGDVIPAVNSATCTPATTCTASEYESTPKGRYTDRVCTPLTVCAATEYESTAPTATSDRACTTTTVCGASEVEITAPSATSDRICGPAGGATPSPPVPPTPPGATPASGSTSTTTTSTNAAAPAGNPTTAVSPTSSGATPTPTLSANPSTPTTAADGTNPTPTTATTTTTTTSAPTDASSSGQPADEVLIDPAAPPANAVRADGGLSGGEQAGISLGVILVIAGVCGLVGFGIWKVKMSKKASKDAAPKNSSTPPLSARAQKYTPQETSIFQEGAQEQPLEEMALDDV